MNLGDLATLLPADPASWQDADPARAFPYDLRASLGTRLAGMFSAADRARPRAAARLGLSTRAYEAGDAFKDLSLPLLARLGDYHTRIDNAPGRSTAVIVVHLYGNMAYASQGARANKGQQALAIAGLLCLVHAGALHGVRLLRCFDADLPAFLVSRRADIGRARWLWVLTDALFDSTRPDGGIATLARPLAARPNLRSNLVVVRDSRELPAASEGTSSLLRPFVGQFGGSTNSTIGGSAGSEKSAADRFSGEAYERALSAQLDALRDASLENGFGRLVASASREVEQIARELVLLC